MLMINLACQINSFPGKGTDELKFAIRSVIESGYYYSHHVTGSSVHGQ